MSTEWPVPSGSAYNRSPAEASRRDSYRSGLHRFTQQRAIFSESRPNRWLSGTPQSTICRPSCTAAAPSVGGHQPPLQLLVFAAQSEFLSIKPLAGMCQTITCLELDGRKGARRLLFGPPVCVCDAHTFFDLDQLICRDIGEPFYRTAWPVDLEVG
jgi:hypothetical protein